MNSFHSATTSGFSMAWSDANIEPDFYEIEFGPVGFTRDQVPDITNIESLSYVFNNLQSGISYEIYIRAVCVDNQLSEWNGPYFYNTLIDNSYSCGINLMIDDNNCPNENLYSIIVDGYPNQVIGNDYYIEHVALNILHSWPADLKIKLISPSGASAVLIEHEGTDIDNFGIFKEIDCDQAVRLSDDACVLIENGVPPYVGTFKPATSLAKTFEGEPINGIWKIAICDNAIGDVGILKYIQINFLAIECETVQNFNIIDIGSNDAILIWDSPKNCQRVRIEYREVDAPISETFIDYQDCDKGNYSIPGLTPETEYVITIYSECSDERESLPFCETVFKTLCQDGHLLTSFDDYNLCDAQCQELCFSDALWHNDITSDEGNWFVGSLGTSSLLTGPSSSFNGFGNYIFNEASLSCPGNPIQGAVLESSCLTISEESTCSFTFFYNAYGSAEDYLVFEINYNESQWEELWRIHASQNRNWQFQEISIPNSSELFELRFRAINLPGVKNTDFGLDHLKFSSIDTISLFKYFVDNDGDGFGDTRQVVFACSNIAPVGYSANSLDCDDTNPEVNPSSSELHCNGLNDDCDMATLDVELSELSYTINSIISASCDGANDASIDIEIVSNETVMYNWSNGSQSQDLVGVSNGLYICTITSTSGCSIVTEDIYVDGNQVLAYNIIRLDNEDCLGNESGLIEIQIENGLPPYEIFWSNGMVGNVISGLSSGLYWATATDANGCYIQTDSIFVDGIQALTVGVISKRDLNCSNVNDGQIRIGVFGGQAPYTYQWQDGQQGFLRSSLSTGTYSVTVMDRQGCIASIDSIEVISPSSLEVNLSTIDHITCHGGFESLIDINVKGGTPPYSFLWSDGSTAEDLMNKKAGFYSVEITDFNNCRTELTNIQIKQNDPITIELDSINNLRCEASDNGYISVNVTGGVAPYSYFWSNITSNEFSNHINSNLSPGRYFLTVVDNFGCKSRIRSFDLVNNNTEVNVSLLIGDEILCHDDTNGSIIAVINNAVLPLDYNWSSGRQVVKPMLSDTLRPVAAGKYNLTITDSEGCVGVSDSISLFNPEDISFSLREKKDVSCYGLQNGEIDLRVNGGTFPYFVSWSNGQNGESISALNVGNYIATITDINGCSVITNSITISQPDSIHIGYNVVNDDGSASGEISLEVTGGNPPYNYFWDMINSQGEFNANLASSLSFGTYTVTVTDDNNCEKVSSIVVDLTSSVNDSNDFLDLLIYPNPAHQDIVIEYSIPFYLLGAKLIAKNGKQMDISMNVSQIDATSYNLRLPSVPDGLYVLQLDSETFKISRKILIFQ